MEKHPLEPFLPPNAKILMLGSFPPPKKRWSMNFFYPNMQNDMWRIYGLLFFADKEHFVDAQQKCFNQPILEQFLNETGIALYDTASAVNRLQDNASDKFLEIVEPTDVAALLQRIPHCQAIVTTGQKATDTLCATFGCVAPKVGAHVTIHMEGRTLRLYRMPSSSRAYPLAIEMKAKAYGAMLSDLGILPAHTHQSPDER